MQKEVYNVKEVSGMMSALENGAKLTYIDPRVAVTATKAHRYWMIRPGTDLALNYALMHVILKEKLYDSAFVEKWVLGLAELRDFLPPYTPQWAEAETGIAAGNIVELAREISSQKPKVVFHYGYRGASHTNEIYMRRTILMLNALMGSILQASGLKPGMFLRRAAVSPLYDTREGAMILKQIAERIGVGRYFPYESTEGLVKWQFEGTGFDISDFDDKGFVNYGQRRILWDRTSGLKLKTPSKKIEFKSSLLEDAGFASFPPYEPVPAARVGYFRLVTGRTALHTHVSTRNVAYLNELCSENVLWINDQKAGRLGIKDQDMVSMTSERGAGQIKAFVTDLIHPETVFLLHGFGHTVKRAARCCNRGLSDALLQKNVYNPVGGTALPIMTPLCPSKRHNLSGVTP